MFAFTAVANLRQVGLVGTGRFWCLYCESEESFQLRTWRQIKAAGAFVRCDACEATFDPECLNESSIASCDELMVSVPAFAWEPAAVEAWTDASLQDEVWVQPQNLDEFLGRG
jgi:methionyl-tRNA synthetase